ncbi:N-alpha-acetyltransferase 30 [Kickxella alabastrina]|uniref:N-alpha-acetyltransferase 30 n=1 Tax=Kickxella alabastrina TaxID=61397 RepID=A0ACC1IQQ4_9FUNG|nr:N-alpha-acetyltransferase 30 [Kickxella alabastrina]
MTDGNSQKDIIYTTYETETDLLPAIPLIEADLSEPYSIYTYRYFVQQWPELCILAHSAVTKECVGVVICKLEDHRRRMVDGYFDDEKTALTRGYIGMVAVDKKYRKRGIGSSLVIRALAQMQRMGADEVILEAEADNRGALAMYEALGFVREKRLHRYYMSGIDAFRLKLWL